MYRGERREHSEFRDANKPEKPFLDKQRKADSCGLSGRYGSTQERDRTDPRAIEIILKETSRHLVL